MSDLLDHVVTAHGGMDRWREVHTITAHLAITGAIWALKGKAGILDDIVFEADALRQRATISPFTAADKRGVFEPGRTAIETTAGQVLEELGDPRSAFIGDTRLTPWDDLDLAYFAGYANWNYLTTPFLLTRPDIESEEIEPRQEDGEEWRSLKVTFPPSIATHSREQVFYFDQDGLLKRIDYAVEIMGSGPAVHYPSAYREFSGIRMPTRRRIFVRKPDGFPAREVVSIAIDVAEVTFA